MLTPKAKAEKLLWDAQLEVAVTYPIDHEQIRELTKGLSVEEIKAIPYLPGRQILVENASQHDIIEVRD